MVFAISARTLENLCRPMFRRYFEVKKLLYLGYDRFEVLLYQKISF